MAERSLELDLYQLEAWVGEFAGYGVGEKFGHEVWTADQQRRITASVDSGLRMVYFTQSLTDAQGKPIEDIPAGYSWSFLQPRSTIELLQGVTELVLPRDCNGLLGDVIPASNDGVAQFNLRVVAFQQVYALRSQSPNQTGRPVWCAEEVAKGTTGTRGTRYTLQVYPIPDADYTLQVWYEISPTGLTAEFPHPHGGGPLAELFKAAVRAAFEQDFDNTRGLETARFIERLRAAIAADRKHKPLYIGLNSDHSDDVGFGLRPLQHGSDWGVPLTVNGVTY